MTRHTTRQRVYGLRVGVSVGSLAPAFNAHCPNNLARSACVIEISGRRRPAIARESVALAFSGRRLLFIEKAP